MGWKLEIAGLDTAGMEDGVNELEDGVNELEDSDEEEIGLAPSFPWGRIGMDLAPREWLEANCRGDEGVDCVCIGGCITFCACGVYNKQRFTDQRHNNAAPRTSGPLANMLPQTSSSQLAVLEDIAGEATSPSALIGVLPALLTRLAKSSVPAAPLTGTPCGDALVLGWSSVRWESRRNWLCSFSTRSPSLRMTAMKRSN
jgi:hypothetical protein